MQEERAEVYGGGTIASVNHLSNLLKNCTLLSVVGGEKNKIKDYKKLIKKNIKQQLFYDKNFQNIVKKRYLDKNNFNKLFQVTNLKKSNISKKTEIKIIKYLNNNLKNYDHVIVHDFGHGALTDKMIDVIEKKSKFLSVNVQTNSSNMGFNYLTKFKKTNYFSIDEPEARLALADDTSDTQILFKKFKKRIRFKLGSITFGKHGSYLYSSNKAYFSPALTSKPVDTLGAGDSYFVISSLFAKQKAKPDLIAFLGNIAGAFTINYLGHRRYITKVDILNYVKTFLNI
jgi:bifunctional ADP-heptose synthase (sugar kinase/adenylyltransferase)